jgi:hypothetical protein
MTSNRGFCSVQLALGKAWKETSGPFASMWAPSPEVGTPEVGTPRWASEGGLPCLLFAIGHLKYLTLATFPLI